MIEVAADHARDQAEAALAFLQAIRVGVPATLDDKARGPYEKREKALLKIINDQQ